MGTLLGYEATGEPVRTLSLKTVPSVSGQVGVLLVGAGWFARTHHLPNLASESKLGLVGVVSGTGANARQIAEKEGAGFAGTDLDEGLARPEVDAVLICTRHNLHVPQAVAAIRAGKHVLIEKPLALDAAGLAAIAKALRENPVRLAVGFNRRHAPLARELAALFRDRQGPLHGTFRMNAGRLPASHWVNDPVEGGGRIRGEGVHAFDFFNFLTGSNPMTVQASKIHSDDPDVIDDDNLTATVTYEDGSLLTLVYTTDGPRDYPKEQIEIFAPDLAARLTDFRELEWSGKTSGKKSLRVEDKGQATEMRAWARYLAGEEAEVVDFEAGAMSTWLTLRALESARQGSRLAVAATLSDALED
jgi:predicted dehydrogenase